MLTNFKTVKQSIKRLKDMEGPDGKPVDGKRCPRRNLLDLHRELEKLEKDTRRHQGHGVACRTPCSSIDVGYHKIAVPEAKKLGIPVIGVVDTNHSPEGIDYVIPGNDDSVKPRDPPVRSWHRRRHAGRPRSGYPGNRAPRSC